MLLKFLMCFSIAILRFMADALADFACFKTPMTASKSRQYERQCRPPADSKSCKVCVAPSLSKVLSGGKHWNELIVSCVSLFTVGSFFI